MATIEADTMVHQDTIAPIEAGTGIGALMMAGEGGVEALRRIQAKNKYKREVEKSIEGKHQRLERGVGPSIRLNYYVAFNAAEEEEGWHRFSLVQRRRTIGQWAASPKRGIVIELWSSTGMFVAFAVW